MQMAAQQTAFSFDLCDVPVEGNSGIAISYTSTGYCLIDDKTTSNDCTYPAGIGVATR
jgi:hypothetical protein